MMFPFQRNWQQRKCAATMVLLILVAAVTCSRKDAPLSESERQQVRENAVASFAKANGAKVVPDFKDFGVTLDWQKSLRGPDKLFAFLGSVDDIFERDNKFFLRISDIDHKLLWVIQCSEPEADDIRSQRERALEDLFLVEVTEIRPMIGEDSITEVAGTLRRFQVSTGPL